ncbi:transmembrane protein [Heterostelium album PN500]|uniref:Transmembrane protein n=1 Tax=Heterostelium pallidum (strain ATCC 26659 / Pp 5 / PN500) TaxID=670386 RepID=D3BP92_HETP5|nr:transmembrane protein [Heterostelium album PN500]EFA77102.1 transmembrane protein [Heterostelium album PN500]|eukprot:XP_020429231.1 transmembrane protein [Heterostelium album PN500]
MAGLSKTVISMNSFVESLVKLFAQTTGKDKLVKILQYGAKLFGYLCQQRKMAHWAGVWKKIEASAGGSRKVWRLGNTFAEQQKILQLTTTGENNEQLLAVQKKKNELYLNCIKNGADAVIAANLLKFYQTSQGTVGICGLISAFIGAYQIWK